MGRRKPGRHCTPVLSQLAYRPRQGMNLVLDKFAMRDLFCGEVSVFGVNNLDWLKGDGQFDFRLDKWIVLGVNDYAV